MKLSIIIPTYNEQKYLPKLLKSIKIQDFKDYEIIVADANSTDDTILIAKKEGCKVVKGGFPGVGRNKGAKYAKGELLLFLDSDTILSKNTLKKALRHFEKKKADVMSLGILPIKTKRNEKKYDFYLVLFDFINFYLKAMSKIRPFSGGYFILIKKELHELIGGFDENLRIGEDFDYTNRAHQKIKPKETGLKYRISKILKTKKIEKKSNFIFYSKLKINLSTRRIDKENIPTTIGKSIVSTFFSLFNQEKIFSEIIDYEFGNLDQKSDKNKKYEKIMKRINKALEKI